MTSYNHPGQDRAMENLLQQLRGQSQSNHSDDVHQASTHDQFQQQSQQPQELQQPCYLGRYDAPPSHAAPGSSGDYKEDDIMPPAPTPPVNNMPASVLAYMSSSGGNSIGAPRAPPNSDHTNNLLNLLKFQQPAARQDPQSLMTSSTYQPRIVAPAPVGQEPNGLLAAMISGVHEEDKETPPPSYAKEASSPSTTAAAQSAAETQNYLLGLLNRPKPAQTDQPQQQFTSESVKSSKSITLTPQSTNDSNADYGREHQQYQQHPHTRSFHNTTSPTYPRHSDSYSYQHVPSSEFQAQHQAQEAAPGVGAQQEQPTIPSAGPAYSNVNPFADAVCSSPIDQIPKSSSITPAAPGSVHAHQSSAQLLKKQSVAGSPHSATAEMKPVTDRSYVESPENLRIEGLISREEAAEDSETVAEPQEPVEDPILEIKETPAEALSEVKSNIDHDVQDEVVNRPDEEQTDADYVEEVKSQPDMPDDEEHVDEMPKEEPSGEEPLEEALTGVAAQEPVVDSWENAAVEADAEEVVAVEEEYDGIPVYNFPMKPWIGLRLLENTAVERPSFRDDSVNDITRLKKEFDQIDRNLVTASESHIIYGMSKNGGLRVISQDDGRDAKLFTDTQDRIFNVSVSISPATDPPIREAMIGTGISGTVYWALIKDGDDDHIHDAHPEQYGFTLPPINSQEGDAPGGVLKTRARPSSMHPEYFAIGRGKTIHMIWPSYIMIGTHFKPGHDRTVNVDSLLSTCSLKINAGKAGKDFTFSADDTTIVTLDKAGKVKFWDIRHLTDSRAEYGQPSMPKNLDMELKDPIISLNTTCDGEKPWPTSVLLVDKPKPYQRHTAQRYMIVGTKQNHSFQLWDLALRKVVQEINLPHGKDSDAACSLMYHAMTGMIIVGHPTRNSVYFLHLSAPKYNLKISQVDYMMRLASPEKHFLRTPESTAVLSGYREINFSRSGTLRSLDLLPAPATAADPDESVLFELYAMHSRGVACVHVRQRDLGWNTDNRVKIPKDAVKEKVVHVCKISSPPETHTSSEPVATAAGTDSGTGQVPVRAIQRRDGEDAPPTSIISAASGRRGPGPESSSATPKVPLPEPTPAPPHFPAEKPEKVKNKRKKGPAAGEDKSTNNTPRPGNKEAKNTAMGQAPLSVSAEQIEQISANIETTLNLRLVDMGSQVTSISERLDISLDARERAFDQRSREILKAVSQQLNTNTQNLLTDLVRTEVEKRVVPAITERTTKTLMDHLNNRLNTQVSHAVQKELAKAVPSALSQAFQDPEVTDYISKTTGDAISSKIANHVENELSSHIFPAMKAMMEASSQQVKRECEQMVTQMKDNFEYARRGDSAQMEHLLSVMQNNQEQLKVIASSQSQLQAEFLKAQQRQLTSPPAGPVASYQTQAPPKPPRDPVIEQAVNGIDALMLEEQFESALVRWLQTGLLNEVFEHYYCNVSPSFLAQVSPLVQLSVAATVSEHINQGKMRERIMWLQALIHSFHSNLGNNLEEQVREITPKIMGMVVSRIEATYLDITRRAPHDPILKVLSGLMGTGNHIVRATRSSGSPARSDHRQMQQQYQSPPLGQYEQPTQYQPREHQMHHQRQQPPQGQTQWY